MAYKLTDRIKVLLVGDTGKIWNNMKVKKVSYLIFFLYLITIKDYKKGFGGQYGVQTDRQDKSAAGWEHRENLEQHESQKGNFFLIIF